MDTYLFTASTNDHDERLFLLFAAPYQALEHQIVDLPYIFFEILDISEIPMNSSVFPMCCRSSPRFFPPETPWDRRFWPNTLLLLLWDDESEEDLRAAQKLHRKWEPWDVWGHGMIGQILYFCQMEVSENRGYPIAVKQYMLSNNVYLDIGGKMSSPFFLWRYPKSWGYPHSWMVLNGNPIHEWMMWG